MDGKEIMGSEPRSAASALASRRAPSNRLSAPDSRRHKPVKRAALTDLERELLAAVRGLLPHVWGHTKMMCKGDCESCQAAKVALAAIAKATGSPS